MSAWTLCSCLAPQIEALPFPPGYYVEWGGEYESQTDAQEALFARFGYAFVQPEGSAYPPILDMHTIKGDVTIGGKGGDITLTFAAYLAVVKETLKFILIPAFTQARSGTQGQERPGQGPAVSST